MVREKGGICLVGIVGLCYHANVLSAVGLLSQASHHQAATGAVLLVAVAMSTAVVECRKKAHTTGTAPTTLPCSVRSKYAIVQTGWGIVPTHSSHHVLLRPAKASKAGMWWLCCF